MWPGMQTTKGLRNLLRTQPRTHKKRHMSRSGFFWRWMHTNLRKPSREDGKASSCYMVRVSCQNGSFKSTIPYPFFINYTLRFFSISTPSKTKHQSQQCIPRTVISPGADGTLSKNTKGMQGWNSWIAVMSHLLPELSWPMRTRRQKMWKHFPLISSEEMWKTAGWEAWICFGASQKFKELEDTQVNMLCSEKTQRAFFKTCFTNLPESSKSTK